MKIRIDVFKIIVALLIGAGVWYTARELQRSDQSELTMARMEKCIETCEQKDMDVREVWVTPLYLCSCKHCSDY